MVSSSQLIQTIRQFMDIAMHHSMRERSHFAKATGLSMPQFGILMQLHYRGNCGVSDIGERFDITNAAASQLVEKLVQSRLIQREEDPSDRRARLLNLTDKGRQLIQSCRSAANHYSSRPGTGRSTRSTSALISQNLSHSIHNRVVYFMLQIDP